MKKNFDLKELLENSYSSYSKSHKKIADYIMANLKDVVFMTAKEIGKITECSEATVVRFAYNLGYKSFIDFMADLGEWAKKDMQLNPNLDNINENNLPDAVKNTLKKDIQNLTDTLNGINSDAFVVALDLIMNARKVFIIGQRNCKPLADLFALNLNMFRDNVIAVSSISSEEIFEQLLYLADKDVVIGICFPDYSMRTIKALEFANQKNSPIISITDSKYSPVNMYSACNLIAESSMTENTESLTSAMGIINCFAVALELKYKRTLKKNKKTLEEIWEN